MRYRASLLVEPCLRHQIAEITFAQGRPIQTIGRVENDFGGPRRTIGALRGTDEHVHSIFEARPGIAGDDHHRVGPFRIEVKCENVPLLQNASALSELTPAVRFSHCRSVSVSAA